MVEYYIDPHVHCRDGALSYKETITHVFQIADLQNVKIIFDMPNTIPPLIDKETLEERLNLVPKERRDFYYVYLAVTSDVDQIIKAIECYDDFSEVIGFKMYTTRDAGKLAVVTEMDQRRVYETLSELGYKGVLAVHCEKESLLRRELWDPTDPYTHTLARPKEAEIESVKDQIKFAKESKFKGVLHICHVSCPETVEIINNAKKDIKITCEVTPHHILWNNTLLKRDDGLIYKTNPPLRSYEDVEKLREYLRKGMIDFIATDHAPHALAEKIFYPYCSGFPSLYLYRYFVEKYLPSIGVKKNVIEGMTYKKIKKTFKKLEK